MSAVRSSKTFPSCTLAGARQTRVIPLTSTVGYAEEKLLAFLVAHATSSGQELNSPYPFFLSAFDLANDRIMIIF